jgi:hypothetical protein
MVTRGIWWFTVGTRKTHWNISCVSICTCELSIILSFYDKQNNEAHYLKPTAWASPKRWSSHADMIGRIHWNAHCRHACLAFLVQCNTRNASKRNCTITGTTMLNFVSIFGVQWTVDSINDRSIHVWICFRPMLNGVHSRTRHGYNRCWLISAIGEHEWHKSKQNCRTTIKMYSWRSLPTFPVGTVRCVRSLAIVRSMLVGLHLENYIPPDLNTTIEVLEGRILVEILSKQINVTLDVGQNITVPSGDYHNGRPTDLSCWLTVRVSMMNILF